MSCCIGIRTRIESLKCLASNATHCIVLDSACPGRKCRCAKNRKWAYFLVFLLHMQPRFERGSGHKRKIIKEVEELAPAYSCVDGGGSSPQATAVVLNLWVANHFVLPPLWSSGQSSWLQIRRSGFDSWRYKIFWEVVDVERGPLSLGVQLTASVV
jgi:hypothetical protein